MAKIHIYDKFKNHLEELNSEEYSLDDFLNTLVVHSGTIDALSMRIEECFDGKDTYFNVLFIPNVIRKE